MRSHDKSSFESVRLENSDASELEVVSRSLAGLQQMWWKVGQQTANQCIVVMLSS